MKIPKWLKLQEEIDYLHFVLGQMLAKEKFRTPFDTMIDKATGYEKKKLADAKKIIAKIEKLKKKFYELK